MKKIRMALVGAGGIGQVHAQALSSIPDVEIAAVVDRDRNKAGKVARTYKTKAYQDLSECLDSVDAVGIYTPPASHKDIACLAMEQGKQVICEKPVASKESDAVAIKMSAERNGVLFMTAFNMRFREGYGLLHSAYKEGRLGKPINYFVQRMGLGAGSFDGWKGYNWRTDPKLMCGMTMESLSHDIDMIKWHLGEIETVYAVTQYSIKELPGFDDNAYIVMKMKSGASVSIQATWSSLIPQNMRGIVGEKGTALIKGPGIWDCSEFSIRTSEMDEISVLPLENDVLDSQSYFLENQHFIDCIRKGKQPRTGIAEGLCTIRVADAILKSAETNAVITL
jgi:predicted dehydrogenase